MIFCVEDDKNINELILYALKANNYEAKGFEKGSDMLQELEKTTPDLIILDIMLPDEDGLQILKKLKEDSNTENIPVIMLTAKSSELDKVVGLDEGADDYITKPFSVLELVSRIKAVLRRTQRAIESPIYVFNEISMDLEKREVKIDDKKINLTFKEFELLLYLIKNSEIVLTRENIVNKVWGYDFEGESRTVDVHIASLRQKLEDKAYYIQTVRNIGYKVGESF